MTTIPDTNLITLPTTTHQDTALADELAAGLRRLAEMVQQHPEIADELRYPLSYILVSVNRRDDVAAFARAGASAGDVAKHQGERYAGVDVKLGRVGLHVYTDREQVCERVVVGTREVTEDVPDPDALAAVPTVAVTKTVEDVEWRCLPLLAEHGPDGGAE